MGRTAGNPDRFAVVTGCLTAVGADKATVCLRDRRPVFDDYTAANMTLYCHVMPFYGYKNKCYYSIIDKNLLSYCFKFSAGYAVESPPVGRQIYCLKNTLELYMRDVHNVFDVCFERSHILRTGAIALLVGTWLTLFNHITLLLGLELEMWVRVTLNYLTPLTVANWGLVSRQTSATE